MKIEEDNTATTKKTVFKAISYISRDKVFPSCLLGRSLLG